jgi:putative membrane protein
MTTTAQLFLSAWTFRPLLLLACAAALALHALRGSPSVRRTGALAMALFALVLALASPIDALAAGYLFSAHMLQHLLLVLVVPPLVLMALPPSREGVPAGRMADRAAGFLLARPVITWGSGIGAMWLWHAQTLCNAASQSAAVRGLQSVSLLVMGAVFYWPLLAPRASWRMSPLAGMAYLFTACIGCSLLGVLITLSPVELCPAFLHPNDALGVLPLIRGTWGLSPAEDQQVGGLLMWVPGCAIYAGGILGLLARWYGADGAEDLERAR